MPLPAQDPMVAFVPAPRALSDVLYVLTGSGDRYVIPTATISAGRSISLGEKWRRYQVLAGLPDEGR